MIHLRVAPSPVTAVHNLPSAVNPHRSAYKERERAGEGGGGGQGGGGQIETETETETETQGDSTERELRERERESREKRERERERERERIRPISTFCDLRTFRNLNPLLLSSLLLLLIMPDTVADNTCYCSP